MTDIQHVVLDRISKFVSQLYEPPRDDLTADEKKALQKYMKMPKSDHTLAEYIMHTAITYYNNTVNAPKAPEAPVDMHELLTDTIYDPTSSELGPVNRIKLNKAGAPDFNIQTLLANDSLPKLISMMHPEARQKKAYVTLDSRYARFTENNTKLTWDYAETLTESDNSTNVSGKVRDIVEMRMHSIVIRKFTSTLKRATILIEELSAQSFIAPNGRRFHFVARLNDLLNPFPLAERNTILTGTFTPDPITYDKYELLSGYRFNEGIYKFNTPITTLNTLTLSIGDPLSLVTIPKDRFERCVFNSASTLRSLWNGGLDVVVTFPEPHYFEVGTYIYSYYIRDITTTDPVYDSIYLDQIAAMEFTYGQWTSATELTINLRRVRYPGVVEYTINHAAMIPSAPGAPGTPSEFTIILNGYRVMANLELTYNEQ